MARLGHLGLLLLGSVTTLSCLFESRDCNLMGCPLMHETTVVVASDEAAFEPLSVSACFNDRCDEGRLELVGGIWIPPHDAARVSSSAFVNCADGPCVLNVHWQAGARVPLAAGDRFAVTATNEAGEVVAQLVEVADGYRHAHPNGEECDGNSCPVVTGVTNQ